ncbi:LysR family transcriptional regulator [Pseudoduganella sp. FT25W]|uniref:LysR family transcriptional regulator n=1 Tax=Duganella alba TaxID=2666081 RepID=A0A6L5QJ60_9BURK|nr:LysR family transcriptional regulator [Duganella alba]MRX09779.1 LysR family transcriptional regulator [Duganella alba]MRX17416.1 LysR family transcriptional regulator [Duganella alba]
MDTIRSLRCFVRAVELGSLSAVAREEGTTQPTISKLMAGLERDLGVRLLERSTTSLQPTPQGRRFYQRALAVLAEYQDAVAEARGQTETPAGLIRLNAPAAFGQFRLNGLLAPFLAQYPQVDIELILDDRMVDLVKEGVDIAVRQGRQLPPDAIARLAGTSPRQLVAAPSYLKARGKPKQPQDLARHDYIRFAWLVDADLLTLHNGERTETVQTRGRYRVNHALAIRESLAAGGGIGLCPLWLVQDLLNDGALVRVLPAWHGQPQPLHLLSPSRRYQPLRARLLLDYLAAQIALLPGYNAS